MLYAVCSKKNVVYIRIYIYIHSKKDIVNSILTKWLNSKIVSYVVNSIEKICIVFGIMCT